MKRVKLVATSSAFICLIMLAMAFVAKAGQESTGSIDGIVLDARGKPVAEAWVMIFCGYRPLGGRIPEARTDKQGHFEVDSLELDRCRVYACKEEDYIPCPPSANDTHVIQVMLNAKVPSVTVQVQLGEKGTVVTGMVRDAISGEPLAASFALRPLQFPDRPMSMSSPAAFRIFIAPLTDYSLEVSAPGHKDWIFSEHNGSKPLRLAKGAHLILDVKLEPVGSTTIP